MTSKNKKNLFTILPATLIITVFSLYSSNLDTNSLNHVTEAQSEQTDNVQTIELKDPKVTKADFNLLLKDTNGNTVSLKDLEGKVIFINFWATWCPPCVAEMPTIQTMYESLDKDKVEVLMVSFDRDFSKAIDYRNKNNFDFEVHAPASAIPPMYETRSIPTTYVIDSKGNLVFEHKGMADYSGEKFRDFLHSL